MLMGRENTSTLGNPEVLDMLYLSWGPGQKRERFHELNPVKSSDWHKEIKVLLKLKESRDRNGTWGKQE